MAEVTEAPPEQTPAPEGEQPAPEHVPPAGAAPEQPASATPPDIGDAIAQMREVGERLERIEQRVGPEAPPSDLYERLTYDPELDGAGYQEQQPAAPAGQPQLSPEEQQLQQYIDQRAESLIEQRVSPLIEGLQRERNEERILSLRDQYPALAEEETVNAVDAALRSYANRFAPEDREAIMLDPVLVESFYLAHEARKAQQTSPEAAASTGEPAEAGESQGVTLETGAGARPGEPEEQHPVDQAYEQALRARPPANKFGF